MRRQISFLYFLFLVPSAGFSQVISKVESYPKILCYASIVHPVITIDKDGTTFNFSKSYTVGFPFGINFLKSNKVGFSLEFAPFIRAENGTSKVTNLLFHPGLMFRYKNGFTFITRLAFGTDGRYGVTPVFNKIFLREKYGNYFISVSMPFRTGNEKPSSVGFSAQIGIIF